MNEEEKKIFDRIEFSDKAVMAQGVAIQNGDLVFSLLKKLTERNAIPQVRILYFTSPEYNIGGRGRSKQQVFEKNGTFGEDVFRHLHFLPYFEYFVFGPDLPANISVAFKEKVNSCGNITSGDILPLAEYAKQLAKSSGLGSSLAEPFFQLAMECKLHPGYAATISEKVKKVKP